MPSPNNMKVKYVRKRKRRKWKIKEIKIDWKNIHYWVISIIYVEKQINFPTESIYSKNKD